MYNESIIKNIKRKAKRTDEVQFVEVNGARIPLFSWIDINANELCNRTCEFCPRGHNYKNENVHMALGLATEIAKQLEELEYNGTISICGNGEPLLHKDIIGLVNCFKTLQVEIVTNGDRLNVELIKNLYANGLNFFVVSMYDGPEQIERNNKLFKEAGISEDQYTLRDRWHDENEEFGLILTNRAGIMKGTKELSSTVCHYMHYSMQIDWNGDVLFCVQSIYDKSVIHGNLNDQSMLDIWSSKKVNDYRKKLEAGNRGHHPCENCDAMGIIHGYNHVQEWRKL